MPGFRQSATLQIIRDVKAFLNFEAGITRGRGPDLALRTDLQKTKASSDRISALTRNLKATRQLLASKVRDLESRDQEIYHLKEQLALASDGSSSRIKPENLVWIFGHGRTGSTWLLSIIGTLEGYTPWPEPLVGAIFGTPYYKDKVRQQEREGFILGNPHKEVWMRTLRRLVLEGEVR